MKRSQVLNIVANYLNDLQPQIHFADSLRDAAELMTKLEELGMKPPGYQTKEYTEYGIRFGKEGYYNPGWEPES